MIHKSRVDNELFFVIGRGLVQRDRSSELEMDSSIVLSKNESITTALQRHSLCKVKLEVDDVVLSDSNENSIQVVDIAGASSYPSPCFFTSTSSVKTSPGNNSSPYKPLYVSIF